MDSKKFLSVFGDYIDDDIIIFIGIRLLEIARYLRRKRAVRFRNPHRQFNCVRVLRAHTVASGKAVRQKKRRPYANDFYLFFHLLTSLFNRRFPHGKNLFFYSFYLPRFLFNVKEKFRLFSKTK